MPEQVEAGSVAPEPSFREQVEAAEQPQGNQDAGLASVASEEASGVQTAEPERVEKVVPLAALHEERTARKELQRQIREHQQNQQELQRQQIEMLREMQRMQQVAQPAPPDPTQDPLGAQYHSTEQLRQEVQQLTQTQRQAQQAEMQRQQYQNFRTTVERMEQAFVQQKPDYLEAVNWAMDRKRQEYVALGMDDDSASQRLNGEAHQIAQMALQRGESPAAVAYRLAETMGYKPKGVSDQQKLQMQKEGQAAAMPAAGGGQSNGRLSLDALAKLKGSEFLSATKGDNWRKLMGGK